MKRLFVLIYRLLLGVIFPVPVFYIYINLKVEY